MGVKVIAAHCATEVSCYGLYTRHVYYVDFINKSHESSLHFCFFLSLNKICGF